MILFDGVTADILSNKKRNPIITISFIGGRKLNISLVFITQLCFAVPKNIGHILHINLFGKFQLIYKLKFQQIALNHSTNTNFKDFMNLCKKMHYKTMFIYRY